MTLREQFEEETGYIADTIDDNGYTTKKYIEWIEKRQKPNLRSEIRKDDNGEVDEILLYVDDDCVFHLETMSKSSTWFAIYTDEETRSAFWINYDKSKLFIYEE